MYQLLYLIADANITKTIFEDITSIIVIITNDIYLMSHINIHAGKSSKCTASRLRLLGNNKLPDVERYKS